MVFLVVLLRVHLRMYLTINAKITMKCESKDNIVSILDFQLLLIMLGPFNDTSHWPEEEPWIERRGVKATV